MRAYKHYTHNERENLALMIIEGKTYEEMAKELGKDKSSISREISRNRNKDGTYNPWRATTLTIHRRRKTYKPKLEKQGEMYEFVKEKLNLFWSPETITAIWNMKNPSNTINHNTIYRSIKAGVIEGVKAKTHLRRRGKRKNLQGGTIRPEKTIHDRCDEANLRSRVGDWEGDTVQGGIGKGFLVTNVDRKSRFLVAEKISNKRAETVSDALEKSLFGKPVKSITLDNGSEFAEFREFEKTLKTKVFFADPHSPWQRGTNENTNGILRFFFPKGYDFRNLADEELQRTVDLINERPRKCLGWQSPKEVFLLHFT